MGVIIKCDTIASDHAINAINYAMDKKEEPKPEVLRYNKIDDQDCLGLGFSPLDVFDIMKSTQDNSVHHIKDSFFRFEICPSMEECKDWKEDDWQSFLDDAIRHLDEDHVSSDGKVKGHHFDLKNSQWVAALHRDTDHYHIHLIANVITENDEVQHTNKCGTSARLAADALATERGWKLAKDKGNKRKERIHKDGVDVLKSMKSFDIESYFQGMRNKGWKIDVHYDSKGNCRGYSVGEDLMKKDGRLSSTVMYKASQLGFGRDLMVSKLEGTWNKLHPSYGTQNIQQTTVSSRLTNSDQKIASDIQPKENLSVGVTSDKETTSSGSVGKNNENGGFHYAERRYISKEHWYDFDFESKEVNIPIIALDEMEDTVNKEYDPDDFEEAPGNTDIIKVAVNEFFNIVLKEDASSGGGGGGTTGGWRDKDEDELKRLAKMAAQRAIAKSTSGLTRREAVQVQHTRGRRR